MIGTDFDQFIFGILFNAMLAHFHILYQYLTALLPQLSEAFHDSFSDKACGLCRKEIKFSCPFHVVCCLLMDCLALNLIKCRLADLFHISTL
jgi:hypothetical protein